MAKVLGDSRQAADERARRTEFGAAEARTRRKLHLALATLVKLVLAGGTVVALVPVGLIALEHLMRRSVAGKGARLTAG